MRQPIYFWANPVVSDETHLVETWHAFARVQYDELSLSYTAEVSIKRPDSRGGTRLVRSAEFVVSKDEAAPSTRMWQVGAYTLAGHSGAITRDDGYDFKTLGSAVWACISKTFEAALSDVVAAINGPRVSDQRPLTFWVYEDTGRLTDTHPRANVQFVQS